MIISLVHEQGNGTGGLVRGSSGGHSLDSKGMVASMVDKSGMVEMPDGSKVVLMTQLEDGSYVQIKGEGASKVTIYFGICFLFRMVQKLNMYPRSYLQVSKNQLPRHRHYHPEISVRYHHNKIIQ